MRSRGLHFCTKLGGKIAPEALEPLGRQGGPRGTAQAPKTASERLLGGLLAALGAFLGPSWRLLGLSWLSRGAPGGSRGASGRSVLVLFLEAGAGTLKFHVLDIFYICSLFFEVVLTIGFRPCGKAGASAHLENTRFRSERMSNLVFRPSACTAKKHINKAEKEKRKHAKTQ